MREDTAKGPIVDTLAKFVIWCLVILFVDCSSETCKYSGYSSEHVMCLERAENCDRFGLEEPMDKMFIIYLHNYQRERLARGKMAPLPSASNMRKMSWDPELAAVAQAQADQCSISNDCEDCRRVDRFQVGQLSAIITSSECSRDGPPSWKDVIENQWFGYFRKIPLHFVSNYSYLAEEYYPQVAWANTRLVGCGRSRFRGPNYNISHVFICNYGPAGNIPGQSIYQRGKPCSYCPQATTTCSSNGALCVAHRLPQIQNLHHVRRSVSEELTVWPETYPKFPELLSCTFSGDDCRTKSIGTKMWKLNRKGGTQGEFQEVTVGPGGNALLFILNGIPPTPNATACLRFKYRKHPTKEGSSSTSLKVFSWSLMGPPVETIVDKDSFDWTIWETQISDLKGYAIFIFHITVPKEDEYGSQYVAVDDVSITAGNCS